MEIKENSIKQQLQKRASSHVTLDKPGQIVPLYKGKFSRTAIAKQRKFS
jgi:hypothetical protein